METLNYKIVPKTFRFFVDKKYTVEFEEAFSRHWTLLTNNTNQKDTIHA